MSVEHHAGRQQLVCNGCDTAHGKTYERDEFDVMLADAKAAGWTFAKVAGAWQHTCPDCRERARPKRQRSLL